MDFFRNCLLATVTILILPNDVMAQYQPYPRYWPGEWRENWLPDVRDTRCDAQAKRLDPFIIDPPNAISENISNVVNTNFPDGDYIDPPTKKISDNNYQQMKRYKIPGFIRCPPGLMNAPKNCQRYKNEKTEKDNVERNY